MRTLRSAALAVSLLACAAPLTAQPASTPAAQGAQAGWSTTILEPGVEPRAKLRCTGNVGDRCRYVFTAETINRTVINGSTAEDKSLPAIEMPIECTIQSVEADGTSVLRATTDAWKTVSSLADAKAQGEIDKVCAAAKGSSFVLRVTPNGDVTISDIAAPADATDSARRMIGALLKAAGLSMLRLPEGEIGAGAKWEIHPPKQTADSHRLANASLGPDKAWVVAIAETVKLAATGEYKNPNLPPEAKAVHKGTEGNIEGRYVLDPARPLPSRLSERTRIETRQEITINGKKLEQVSTMDIKRSLVRLDAPAPAAK